jgi:hypothetical protein
MSWMISVFCKHPVCRFRIMYGVNRQFNLIPVYRALIMNVFGDFFVGVHLNQIKVGHGFAGSPAGLYQGMGGYGCGLREC